MAKKILVDVDTLRKLVDYNPETGAFSWKERSPDMFKSQKSYRLWLSNFFGRPAFNSKHNSGYLSGGLLGTVFLSHRAAWAHYYGEWPDFDLDHKNCVRTDNRIENLRPAERVENNRNKSFQENNTSGYKGVDLHKGKWRARIRFDNRSVHIGYFSTPEAAYLAYCNAAQRLHGEFANLG